MRSPQSHWKDGRVSWTGKSDSPCSALHYRALSTPLNPAISPTLSAFFPILSITIPLWIPFALLAAPLPTSQLHLFHFNVPLPWCSCHIMRFLMGRRWAWMSRHNPDSLCAVLGGAVQAGSSVTPCALWPCQGRIKGARHGAVSPCFCGGSLIAARC